MIPIPSAKKHGHLCRPCPWQVEKRADAARPIAPAAAAPATAPGTAPATNAPPPTAALGDSGGFGVGGYCLW